MSSIETIPYGYCRCGCGGKTRLASKTRHDRGQVAGEPVDFIKGHNGRFRGRIPPDPNPSGLCQCGCGRPTSVVKQNNPRRGLYVGHHRRRAAGCSRRMAHDDYSVDPETGCWNWNKTLRDKSYGVVRVKGQTLRAHRVYWERSGRYPIPDGYHLHHKCKNTRCVNPDHMAIVSPSLHLRYHRPKGVKFGEPQV